MATINSSIRLTDNLTATVNGMNASLEAMVSTMKSAQKAGSGGFIDKSAMSSEESAVKNAGKAVQDLESKVTAAQKAASSGIINESAVKSESGVLKDAGKSAQELGNKVTEAGKSASEASGSFSAQAGVLDGLSGKITAVVGAYAGFTGIKKLVGMSDEMSSINSRLTLMTGSLEATDQLNQKIMGSANNARGSYTDMADLVSKLGLMAGSAFGGGNDQIVSFAEQVSKLGALGGSSTQEMSAGMLQLEQALASGTLRGDELNSVMEQMPYFAQTLAKGLGVTTGELRTMGFEGQLTADQVVGAIMNMSGQTDSAFQGTATTFGQVWNLFRNNAQDAIKPVMGELGKLANNPEFQTGMAQMGQSIAQLIPYVIPVVNGIAGIAAKVGSFSDIIPVVMALVGAFATYQAITTAVRIATAIYSGIELAAVSIKAAKTGATLAETSATAAATATQWGLNAAMLASPVTWIVLGIAALVAIVILLATHWDQVKAAGEACWNGIVQAFSPAMEGLKRGWEDFRNTFGPGWNAFTGACNTAMENTKTVGSAGMGMIKGMMENDNQAVIDNAKKIWNMLPSGVQDGLISAYHGITGWWDGVNKFFSDLPSKFYGWGQDMMRQLSEGIKNGIDWVKEQAEGAAQAVSDFLHFSIPETGPLTSFNSWMPDMMSQMAAGISAGTPMVSNAAKKAAQAVEQPISNINTSASYGSQQSGSNQTGMNMQPADTMQKDVTVAYQTMQTDTAAITAQMSAQNQTEFNGMSNGLILNSKQLRVSQAVEWSKIATETESNASTMRSGTEGQYSALSNGLILNGQQLRVSQDQNWTGIKNDAFNAANQTRTGTNIAYNGMCQDVLRTMASWKPKMYSTSVSYMNDIVSGMESQRAAVTNESSSIVQALLQTFITGLGIASPAKKGIYIGQMYLLGLMKGMSPVQMKKFVSHIIDLMQTSFAGGKMNLGKTVDTLGDNIPALVAKIGADPSQAMNTMQMLWPLLGYGGDFTSYFGYRTDGYNGSGYHEGVDISGAGINGVPIDAVLPGLVTIAGEYGGYGNAVQIDHGNGLSTLYGHMSAITTSVGTNVGAGQQIGNVGSTGWSTGAHLHFSVLQNGNQVDPLPYLQGAQVSAGNTLGSALMAAYYTKKYGVSLGSGGGANAEGAQAAISAALGILGLSQSLIPGLMYAAQNESGYDATAINNWDSNAAAGHPSKGLFQTIDSTFNAYKYPGHDNIYNMLDNALAAIRYMQARYGSVEAVVNPRLGGWYGYATGTRSAAPGWQLVGENGPEFRYFKGGETVLTNSETRRAMDNSTAGTKLLSTASRRSASSGRDIEDNRIFNINMNAEIASDMDIGHVCSEIERRIRDEAFASPDGLY